jgi:FlaG/FlaF family flagellin (archaellin)
MKGVEPLVAAILLFAVTVSVAIILSAWVTSITEDTTKSVSTKTTTTIGCSSASISVDEVYSLNRTRGVAIVRNDGFVNLSIAGAQFINVSGNNFTTTIALPVRLDRGHVISLDFNISLSSCPESFSKVIVSSDCGIDSVFDGMPKCL